jgi:hypothetical protein
MIPRNPSLRGHPSRPLSKTGVSTSTRSRNQPRKPHGGRTQRLARCGSGLQLAVMLDEDCDSIPEEFAEINFHKFDKKPD